MSDDDVLDAFDGETLDLIVPGTLDEIRVDRVLALLTGLSRSEANEIIASGAVTLNDKVVVKSSTPVLDGQRLVAVLPAPREHGRRGRRQRPGRRRARRRRLRRRQQGARARSCTRAPDTATARWSPVCWRSIPRCDCSARRVSAIPCAPASCTGWTKGPRVVLVVAKTPEGFTNLSTQLAERLMERTYYGMVEGHVAEERGVVDAPIGRSTRTPTVDGGALRRPRRAHGI